MKQCTTLIGAHNGQKVQCSREMDHKGEHCADVVVHGNTQRTFAENREFDKNVIPYSMVVKVKPDDEEIECQSCGIKYVERDHAHDHYCVTCSFWISRAKNFQKSRSENITGRENTTIVTLDYELYSICPSDTRGFSSATFEIGLLGSNETINVKGPWLGGTVPMHLRDEFKPNVRFAKRVA